MYGCVSYLIRAHPNCIFRKRDLLPKVGAATKSSDVGGVVPSCSRTAHWENHVLHLVEWLARGRTMSWAKMLHLTGVSRREWEIGSVRTESFVPREREKERAKNVREWVPLRMKRERLSRCRWDAFGVSYSSLYGQHHLFLVCRLAFPLHPPAESWKIPNHTTRSRTTKGLCVSERHDSPPHGKTWRWSLVDSETERPSPDGNCVSWPSPLVRWHTNTNDEYRIRRIREDNLLQEAVRNRAGF